MNCTCRVQSRKTAHLSKVRRRYNVGTQEGATNGRVGIVSSSCIAVEAGSMREAGGENTPPQHPVLCSHSLPCAAQRRRYGDGAVGRPSREVREDRRINAVCKSAMAAQKIRPPMPHSSARRGRDYGMIVRGMAAARRGSVQVCAVRMQRAPAQCRAAARRGVCRCYCRKF